MTSSQNWETNLGVMNSFNFFVQSQFIYFPKHDLPGIILNSKLSGSTIEKFLELKQSRFLFVFQNCISDLQVRDTILKKQVRKTQ